MEIEELSRIASTTAQEVWAWANNQDSAPLDALLRDIVALANGVDPDEWTVSTDRRDDGQDEITIRRIDSDNVAAPFHPIPGEDFSATQLLIPLLLPKWRMHSLYWDDDEEQVTAYLASKDGTAKAQGKALTPEGAVLVAVADAVNVTLRNRASNAPFERKSRSAPAP